MRKTFITQKQKYTYEKYKFLEELRPDGPRIVQVESGAFLKQLEKAVSYCGVGEGHLIGD